MVEWILQFYFIILSSNLMFSLNKDLSNEFYFRKKKTDVTASNILLLNIGYELFGKTITFRQWYIKSHFAQHNVLWLTT